MRILSRKSKSIRLLYLQNSPVENFDEFLTIKFKFSNAVSYIIDGKKTLHNIITVPNPGAAGMTIALTVNGLFRKNDYIVSVQNNEVVITRMLPLSSRPVFLENKPGETERPLVLAS